MKINDWLTNSKIIEESEDKTQQLQDVQRLHKTFLDIPNKHIEEYQKLIVDRLSKSINAGGSVNFYNPHLSCLIGIARTIDDFKRLYFENGVEVMMVFVRPDGTAISEDEEITTDF
ncbi:MULTISPECIES: hypothetical protein [unclassified Dysgonomonas]|uniref:hypothetical protein n=1 Tax=unclassified Dysgonomonas TaxID=2630389 RepID=UPI0024764800|nr:MULTISPECIES: hypothetical protein [unclassified Dysgonomonas]